MPHLEEMLVTLSGQSLHGQLPGDQLPHSQLPSEQPPRGQLLSDQLPHSQRPRGQLPSDQLVLLQVLEDMKLELMTSFKGILDALNLLFSAHEFLTTHGTCHNILNTVTSVMFQ